MHSHSDARPGGSASAGRARCTAGVTRSAASACIGTRRAAGSPRRERGAAGLFFTLTLLMMVLFLALAVDTGRLVYAQRQLQSIADLAALDAARVTGPCSGAPVTDPAQVLAAAQAAASARDFLGDPYPGDLGDAPNAVTVGTVTTGADNIRQFTPSAAADAEAVQVVLNEPVTRSIFLPGIYPGTVNLSATAVARAPAVASFSPGSFLVGLDSSQGALLNAVLGALLGSSLNLDVASYQGLADAQVGLLQLLEVNQLGAATLEELLAADLTVAQLLNLTATALQADDPNAADIVLGQILGAGVGVNTTIQLGELLALDLPADNAALATELNVLDLITASAQLANEGNFVDVPGVGVNLPLPGLGTLASVDLGLHIIEAPTLGAGPPGLQADGSWRTEAHTSQIGLEVAARVIDLDLNLLGIIELDSAVNLDLFVQGAQTSVHLDSIRCGGLLAPTHRVQLGAEPGLARAGIGTLADPDDPTSPVVPTHLADLSATVGLGPLSLVELAIPLTVGADVDVSPGPPENLVYVANDLAQDLPQTQTATSDLSDTLDNTLGVLLSNLTLDIGTITADVAGIPLGDLVNVLLDTLGLNSLGEVAAELLSPVVNLVLSPLLDALSNLLLEPLLGLLGVSLGGADVTLISVEAGQPELVI